MFLWFSKSQFLEKSLWKKIFLSPILMKLKIWNPYGLGIQHMKFEWNLRRKFFWHKHCVEKWFVLCNPWKFYTFIKIRLNCSIKVSNFGGPNKNIKFPLFLCILKFLRTVGDLNLDEFQEAWWGFVNSMKI